MTDNNQNRPQLKIFRATEAADLVATECMTLEPMSDEQQAGIGKLLEAGFTDGEEVKVLVEMPGFSLTYAWFKKDYPLMRHSHNSDCMYYIIAGMLKLGTQELGPRDCFFLPADAPYAYTAGPDGVEVLEIRHDSRFNFVNLVHGEAWWEKAAEICMANRNEWKQALRPSEARLRSTKT